MTLTKPNQELHRHLKGLANDLKLSAVELMRITVRLNEAGNEADAQAMIRICQVMQAGEDRLAGCANEVGNGQNIRTKEGSR